jgi:hypothetical protein
MQTNFSNNIALSGRIGGLSVSTSSNVNMLSNQFINNEANSGLCGAMTLTAVRDATMDSNVYRGNEAKSGGAVCVENGSLNISLSNTQLVDNKASLLSAGAILITSSWNVAIVSTLFANNLVISGDGSAIWIYDSNVTLLSNYFVGNKALAGGGAVYWLTSSGMAEPAGLRADSAVMAAGSNIFEENQAMYGSDYATEALYIDSDSGVEVLDYIDYDRAAPPLTISLKDWYKQSVLTDSWSAVTVSVSDDAVTNECGGKQGFISGTTELTLVNGSATFASLEPLCAPTYNLSLVVSSALSSVTESFLFQYNLRACIRGEYFADLRVCASCDEGSYSFLDSSTVALVDLGKTDVCRPCPSGAKTCFADQIVLDQGYWRIAEDSIMSLCVLWMKAAVLDRT